MQINYLLRDGILIEANPDAFMDLKLKHRKSWLMGNCLSTKEHSEVVDFDAAGLLGGIIHDGKRPGRNPVTEDKHTFGAGLKIPGLGEKHTFERRTLRLECYPLYTILNAIGNPTVHYFRYVFRIPTFNGNLGKKVNSFLYHLVPSLLLAMELPKSKPPLTFNFSYCSLDVEGSELPILRTIPFDKVDIKVLDIEIKHAGRIFSGSHEEITNWMDSQGYDLYAYIAKTDAIYVKRGYLDELNEF